MNGYSIKIEFVAGTVGEVALELGRNCTLVDLDPKNELLMRQRIAKHVGQGHFTL